MKKLILSLSIIIIFAFYAFWTSSKNTTLTSTKTLPTELSLIPTQASSSGQRMMGAQGQMMSKGAMGMMSGKYKDGVYTGPITDVYYGNVQVKATISGGKLSEVEFLQYPNDRKTSIAKSSMAMPILKSEAITAQSATVDAVSGATETSKGFITSLGGALAQATN